MSVSSCKKFEDCEKTYTINGRVIDQSSNPVADVKIRWHYDDTSTPEAVLGYTDGGGNYSIPYSTRSNLQGASIEFVKSGFTTQVGEKYTEVEAGAQLCGFLNLVRNVTFSP